VRERGIFERRGKCKDRFLVRKKPLEETSRFMAWKKLTKIEKIFGESILFSIRKPVDKHNIGVDRNFSLSQFFLV